MYVLRPSVRAGHDARHRPPSSVLCGRSGPRSLWRRRAASSQLIRRWREGGRAFVVQRDWFGAAALRSSTSSSTRGEESQKEHQRQKEERERERGGKRNRRGRQREKRESERRGDHPGALLSFSFYMTFWRLKAAALQSVAKEECVGRERESGEGRDASWLSLATET